MFRLETERLFLREMTYEDFDSLYAVLADSDIMRYYPYTFDKERVRNWIFRNIERYNTFGFGLWAVCLKSSGEMIGDCGLSMQSINGVICPEIGYHIRADRQRQGYAGEAALAVARWTFSNTPFNRIFSYMTSDNIPSIRCAVSWGCRFKEQYTDTDGTQLSVYVLEKSGL